MKYYIIKTDKGYIGAIYRGIKDNKMYACDYTHDGLHAIKCPIKDVWHEERLRREIEDYLESKNISYEIHILDYSTSLY